MQKIEIFMNPKGITGKTVFANWFSEAMEEREETLERIFVTKGALQSATIADPKRGIHFDLSHPVTNNLLDSRVADRLTGLLKQAHAKRVIIDTDSIIFMDLLKLLAKGPLSPFRSNIRIHVPLVYGSAYQDIMRGLENIFLNLPDTPVIVWINGLVPGSRDLFKDFDNSELRKFYANQIERIVTIKMPDQVNDLSFIIDGLSFSTAIDETPIMQANRIQNYWRDLNETLSRL